MLTRARSLVWLEHPAHNRTVVGSNPAGPTSQHPSFQFWDQRPQPRGQSTPLPVAFRVACLSCVRGVRRRGRGPDGVSGGVAGVFHHMDGGSGVTARAGGGGGRRVLRLWAAAWAARAASRTSTTLALSTVHARAYSRAVRGRPSSGRMVSKSGSTRSAHSMAQSTMVLRSSSDGPVPSKASPVPGLGGHADRPHAHVPARLERPPGPGEPPPGHAGVHVVLQVVAEVVAG